jgi:TATA-binding protein-associated factor Taf7
LIENIFIRLGDGEVHILLVTCAQVTDICQILLVSGDPFDESKFGLPPIAIDDDRARRAAERARERALTHKHGLTPAMRNARRHLRKTVRKKWLDASDVDRAVKQLLRDDLLADEFRWDVLAGDSADQVLYSSEKAAAEVISAGGTTTTAPTR